MIDVLSLRLDAPLMSFGGVQVDQRGPTEDFPVLSMLTGLIANALGYEHKDSAKHQRLQDRLRFAARRDRTGVRVVDYQSVFLGHDFMHEGWTTWRVPEGRGGASAEGTTLRFRHYHADAVFTVALTLSTSDEAPTLEEVAAAIQTPERPLYFGRKPCLPSSPLFLGLHPARSLVAALQKAPRIGVDRADTGDKAKVWWFADEQESADADLVRRFPITDERDWVNQIHVGRRFMCEGWLRLGED